MQTITIPWSSDDETRATAAELQRIYACMVRTGYAQGDGRSAAEIERIIKDRFPDQPLGSWAAHCAALEAKTLRAKVPDGAMVFGGKSELLRRQKGLTSNDDWKARRHGRALEIIGDRTRWGNRHFRLSPDASTCKVEFLGKNLTLNLQPMVGKHGALLRAVVMLADACQMSVQFGLKARTLTVTFDEMDLRRLPPGKTLEDIKIAEQGASRKGRKRKDASTHYAAHRVKHIADRPVHPEWRDPVPVVATRAIGLDLNPQWVGISVIEVNGDPQNADSVRILDHRLHHIAIPFAADAANMTRTMANIAADIISLARAWNCDLLVHEEGLGMLAWSKKSHGASADQTVNHWSRNVLIGGLTRRCGLAGIRILPIWGGYSTTIGNMLFDLPDACASAAEIARRGFALTCGIKDRFPVVPVQVASRRWKDEKLPTALAKALASADTWQAVHRAIKPAQRRGTKATAIGYRRLHPSPQEMVPGSVLDHSSRRYAVNRLGSGKGVCCSARPVHLPRTVRDSSDRVTISSG